MARGAAPSSASSSAPSSAPGRPRGERTKLLRILSSKLQRAHHERHIGTMRPVLFEAGDAGPTMEGYTDNYIRVELPYDPALVNTVVPVTLERFTGEGHMTGPIGAFRSIEVLTA